jgi:hypothetical protein
VDALSRVWVSYFYVELDIIAYYDGDWHIYDTGSWENIISDRAGGVWMSSDNQLIHIKNDLAAEYYSSSNSELPDEEILSLYIYQNQVLWIVQDDPYGNRNLLTSFDGTHWIDCGGFENYPDGILTVTDGDAGDLLVLCQATPSGGEGGEGGEGENQSNGFIYLLKDNTFSLYKDGFYLPYTSLVGSGFVSFNGTEYCIGDLENAYAENLLKISGEIGPAEQNV